MGEVAAISSITVPVEPARVLAAIADYRTVRPRILPAQYRDYRVVDGGTGSGTVVEWTLQATQKRARQVRASVEVVGNVITETDANSSLVSTWTVTPRDGGAEVGLATRWRGAGGIGGIFEGIFAPIGLRRIQAEVLANLRRELS